MDIEQWVLWLSLWQLLPALAQIGIAFAVAWAMLIVLDWIFDELDARRRERGR